MNYLQIEFKPVTKTESEMLIAFLSEVGFDSFVEEDKSLKAVIKEETFNKELLEGILQTVPANHKITVMQQQNWNAQWESSFDPLVVKDLVAIRAAFHQPVKHVQHEIIITPKMSFGTGHHATTFMMIEQMSGVDFKNKSVLDFGTGTGILSILAEKMGASAIDAVDNDDWSIENAKENIAANKCSRIKILQADSISAGKTYDIILANISLNVIVDNIQAITFACNKNSRMLLSGFLKQDEAVLLQSLSRSGIVHLNILEKGEWICVYGKMN